MPKTSPRRAITAVAASTLAAAALITSAGTAAADSYTAPTGVGKCTFSFNVGWSPDNGGMLGASVSAAGGGEGCAAGNMLLQIVCKDYSSPVRIHSVGVAYWMLVGGAVPGAPVQSWCDIRARWGLEAGAKSWGPESTIRWTPENGFSKPFNTKPGQAWFPKAP